MSRFSKVAMIGLGLFVAGIVLVAGPPSNWARAASQTEPAAEKETARPDAAVPNHKTYALDDLSAITIFGNNRTAERLRASAAIKTTSADQVKGLIESRGGNHLALRVLNGDHTETLHLKATDQTQVTLDGRNVKMMDLKPLQVALVATSSDRSTVLKIEAQNLPNTGDGKTHQILAMAVAGPKANRLYVSEAVADLGGAGVENGEYLLWTLASAGQVIHKELLKKKEDSYDPPPGTFIIPLPEPQQGAIVMGPFGKLSGIHQWRLFHVDRQGMTAAELEGIWSCRGAALTADDRGILAVGDNVGIKRIYGMLWNLDLDGKILSKKSYERRTLENFNDIASADERGGFIIAEDSPKAINKFGLSEGSVWLLRCDREGKVLTETSFPGRRPRIRALGSGHFAVLYQSLSPLSADWQLRVVDLQLNEQWGKNLGFAGFGINPPALSPTAKGGLVLAIGPGWPSKKKTDQQQPDLEIVQLDREGHRLFSASIPAISPLIEQDICAAYTADCVYVAVRTAGFLFRDGVESSIYRIPVPAPR